MSEQKKLESMDDIRVFLEGMGFSHDDSKAGLYKKTLGDGSFAYWDFRKNKAGGKFYAAHSSDDGGAFWDDKDAQQLSEYVEVRKMIPVEHRERKTAEKKPLQPVQEHPLSQQTGSLVVRDENMAHDLMNMKDDEQVLAEMEGKYLEEFVYSFTVEGGKRTVTGLSWAGTKECVRSLGGIEVEDVKITETPESFRVLAKARDNIRHISMFGVAEQSKKMKLKSGDLIDDQHALSKCLSRAQRNSLRVLLPEIVIKNTIAKYLEDKKKQSSVGSV